MQIHELKRVNKNKTKKRIGRGGKRGKTSGQGHKGQKARGVPRPALRDIIKKMPKLRGYKFGSPRAKVLTINTGRLEAAFMPGDAVNPATLAEKSLIKKTGRSYESYKIVLGGDPLKKKLIVTKSAASASAVKVIESAGGSFEAIAKKEGKKKAAKEVKETKETEVKEEKAKKVKKSDAK